jgi:protein-disulfide isomerase
MGGRHLVQSAVPMFLKISAITVLALLSLSPPQSQADEIAALKRQIQELQTQQTSMERDLQAIKSILQEAQARQQAQAPAGDPFVSKTIAIANEPTRGNAAAKITIVEVSDYHCPFCRRQTLQTLPQLMTDYVNSGKVKYVFVDYPIAQLHPDAFQSHEAADCAGDQGKYWPMHDSLFTNPPARDAAQLTAQAKTVGVDEGKFAACLGGGVHAAAIRESIARMQQLGVGGTPLTLIGLTPAAGAPMKVVSSVYGARPYADFKTAIDAALAQAR